MAVMFYIRSCRKGWVDAKLTHSHSNSVGLKMKRLSFPVSLIEARQPESFPAGSLIFAGYNENLPDDLQVAIRVGGDKSYFALTPWFGGHVLAGNLSDMYPRHVAVYGVDAAHVKIDILFDVLQRTGEWPGYSPTRGGQLALGPAGLHVLGLSGSEPWNRRLQSIDPRAWGVVEVSESYQHWLHNWQLSIKFEGVAELQTLDMSVALDPETLKA